MVEEEDDESLIFEEGAGRGINRWLASLQSTSIKTDNRSADIVDLAVRAGTMVTTNEEEDDR